MIFGAGSSDHVGVMFFEEVIGVKFLMGTGIILMANYFILRRERAQAALRRRTPFTDGK